MTPEMTVGTTGNGTFVIELETGEIQWEVKEDGPDPNDKPSSTLMRLVQRVTVDCAAGTATSEWCWETVVHHMGDVNQGMEEPRVISAFL